MSEIANFFKLKNSLASETVIDACAHVGYVAGTQPVRRAARALIGSMDWLGVSRAWIFSLASVTNDYIMANTDCLRAVREFPDRFEGLGFVNPDYPGEFLNELERCRDAGLAGIVIDPQLCRGKIDSSAFDPLWQYAEQNRILLMGLDWGDRECLENLLGRMPNATVICARGAMQYAHLAARFDNLYLIARGQEGFGAIEEIVRRAGYEKVLFGSDATSFNLAGALGAVTFSALSDQAKRAVLGLNAASIMERLTA